MHTQKARIGLSGESGFACAREKIVLNESESWIEMLMLFNDYYCCEPCCTHCKHFQFGLIIIFSFRLILLQ